MPSWWANVMQVPTGAGSFNFRPRRVAGSETQIEVPAGAGEDAAAIGIDGRIRFRETTVQRAAAGAAGKYRVFVTAAENDIVSTPSAFTDATDRNFDLAIVLDPGTPPLSAGVVDVFREVANLDWDGTRITRFEVTVGNSPTSLAVAKTIGDGAALFHNVDHNLNSRDVVVQAYRMSDFKDVLVEVERTSVNQVRIRTDVALAVGEIRVIVTRVPV